MTANKRVQLKSDILYEHHKAEQDIRTELLTLTLKRWQERLQAASERLKFFIAYLEGSIPQGRCAQR
jgi:hypothetical protein